MRALQFAVLALVGVGLLAPPAGAQEDEAFVTVDQAHPAQGSTHYFVSVADADGEPVTDAEVTATPISPNGEEGETVALASSGDGVYEGPVPMNEPGEWTVRFESDDPAGSTDATQLVSAAQTPIESVPTDGDGTSTTSEDDDSSSTLPLILLLGGLAAVAVLAVVLFLRGAPDEPPTATPDADTTPDTEKTPSTDDPSS